MHSEERPKKLQEKKMKRIKQLQLLKRTLERKMKLKMQMISK